MTKVSLVRVVRSSERPSILSGTHDHRGTPSEMRKIIVMRTTGTRMPVCSLKAMTGLSKSQQLVFLSMCCVSIVRSAFFPAKQGCGMAHCDARMSDRSNFFAPEGDVEVLWADRDPIGAAWMVGCSSNGRQAVCSFGPLGNDPFLKAYNGDGEVLWSYDGLGPLASHSAPLIDDSGRVIAADSRNLVLLENDGSVIWRTPLPGGIPISPVVTEDGSVIVLTTTTGWTVAFSADTGTKLGEIRFFDTIGGKEGYFRSRNTPAVSGNRVYSVTEFFAFQGGFDATRTGRVFAVDITERRGRNRALKQAWTLDFGSRSGGSPTIVNGTLYFDGDNVAPRALSSDNEEDDDDEPHFFGVRDMGSYGKFLFKTPLGNNIRASASSDPLGRGIWFTAEGGPFSLLNLRGEVEDLIDINDYASVRVKKASIATFGYSNSTGNPVAMFTAGSFDTNPSEFYHVGVDVLTKELMYQVKTGDGVEAWSTSQAATVLDSRGEPVVVLITAGAGVVALGRRYITTD